MLLNIVETPPKIIYGPLQSWRWIFQQISHYKLKYIYFSSKILIWVLKWIVLTSSIRFTIIKIIQKSFTTRKMYIIEIYILLIENVLYLSTVRSPKNFYYRNTYSARQDGSFKYLYWYLWREEFNFKEGQLNFQFIMWNLLTSSFLRLEWTRNVFGGVLTIFNKKVSFWVPYALKKIPCTLLN